MRRRICLTVKISRNAPGKYTHKRAKSAQGYLISRNVPSSPAPFCISGATFTRKFRWITKRSVGQHRSHSFSHLLPLPLSLTPDKRSCLASDTSGEQTAALPLSETEIPISTSFEVRTVLQPTYRAFLSSLLFVFHRLDPRPPSMSIATRS